MRPARKSNRGIVNDCVLCARVALLYKGPPVLRPFHRGFTRPNRAIAVLHLREPLSDDEVDGVKDLRLEPHWPRSRSSTR